MRNMASKPQGSLPSQLIYVRYYIVDSQVEARVKLNANGAFIKELATPTTDQSLTWLSVGARHEIEGTGA